MRYVDEGRDGTNLSSLCNVSGLTVPVGSTSLLYFVFLNILTGPCVCDRISSFSSAPPCSMRGHTHTTKYKRARAHTHTHSHTHTHTHTVGKKEKVYGMQQIEARRQAGRQAGGTGMLMLNRWSLRSQLLHLGRVPHPFIWPQPHILGIL